MTPCCAPRAKISTTPPSAATGRRKANLRGSRTPLSAKRSFERVIQNRVTSGLAASYKRASGRHPDVAVEKLRCEIGAVRPDKCVELRMDGEVSEEAGIAQWFEDGAAQRRPEINLSGRAIPEPKPDDMTADIPRFKNMVVFHHHSSGAIGFNGCP